MNIKYLRAEKTAQRMIRENGALFQMQELGGGYVTWDSTITTFDEMSPKAYMVILPMKPDEYSDNSGFLDLTQVRKVLVSTENLTRAPQAQEQVMYQGEWWTLEGIVNLAPDGETDIYYKGVIRRV